MPDADPDRRRRRRRATAQQGPPAASDAPAKDPTPAEPARTREGKGRRTDAGRGDRDLAGTVASQVGPTGAMRARDLNRPTAEDLAEAEAELTIVRRHWNAADQPPSTQPARSSRRRS